MITSIDPRTGTPREEVAESSSAEEVDRRCEEAQEATTALEGLGRAGRAAMLRAMGSALEERRASLVRLADQETALGEARLNGELTRTVFQLGFFAEVLEDGAYLELVIDHAGPTPMGPRPDLRRMLRPLGPVAVFGASNFPFAFSVPGGDSASALAAGCPVVAKAHDAHPATSVACAEALLAGAASVGLDAPVLGLVFGEAAGVALVRHERVHAVGFTGSLKGGRALARIAAERATPIPFYGELGALNAVVVCPAAAKARAAAIGAGLAGSFTLGVGQFCTKPGIVFVPADPGGDALEEALAGAVRALPSAPMLSERIAGGFRTGASERRAVVGVQVLAEAEAAEAGPFAGRPLLLAASAEVLSGALLEECFGPLLVVVRYRSDSELTALLARLSPGLTATVHADDADATLARDLVARLSGRAGRVVWNGYPTGVAVAWAMHHGGPYPATTDPLHTSVGAHAIRRWLRPVCYQDVPEAFLPPELVDVPSAAAGAPRRVDGRLEC